ncbi:hypothetical protein SPRG_00688 [Saprolegnia parasitica CBS 223.65]|uniref:DUF6818 domain-containing protein n=1 Tax=Saprolegnia parasitica (strain CBS 223.65) TaxID=695850 RepID=A0A067CZE5_SAPPC|nr:hypothetical protein SPRG_00688 [Saprolegnia parasitica CBS 223.65]KDO34625.1 hypothetical protein SPRG_00688 [Saprolegnia parasitica CBS 223.65]|eukprot:XP_012194301.1 hypothetical protein SPRG_00688 [Saprolegnia parasitica CBS 223.65]
MLKRTGHGRGKGWKANEELDLLACVSDILPVDTNEWEDVVIAYNFHRQRADRRDLQSVRRKYKSLRNMASGTGSLTTRQHSAEAKRIQDDINRKKAVLTLGPSDGTSNNFAAPTAEEPAPEAIEPPAAPLANVYASQGLRPKEIAAFSKRVPKRGTVPPSRRQILIAMRNTASTPEGGDDEVASPPVLRLETTEYAAAMDAVEPLPRPMSSETPRRLAPLAKRPRSEVEDHVLSRLLAMEESRERWMREMEERRESRERERDERFEALRLEREERDRQREEYRDKMDAQREERAARHDELMAMVLSKLLQPPAAFLPREGPAI